MHHQKLDDDGLASSYFLLTAILPFGLYSISRIFKSKHVFVCKCENCSKRKPKHHIGSIILQSICWITIAILVKNILTIKIKGTTTEFDPYTILNVTPESSLPEIKKSFRKILKSYRTKLNVANTEEEAENAVKTINKAFALLKDPEALDKWMKGDDTKTLLIALPSILLRFSTTLLLLYILILVVAVPLYFFRKQSIFKNTSFSGSNYLSNEAFLDQIDNCSELPTVAIHHIIVLMGRSVEFSTRKWKSVLISNLARELETKYAFAVMSDNTGYLYILEYLFRMIDGDEDREFVRLNCLNLIESYMKIALIKEKTKVFEALIALRKMVHQAVFNPEYYQLQYPFVTFDMIYENKVQDQVDGAKSKQPLRKGHSDSQFLTDSVAESKLKISLNVLNSIPRASIEDLKAYVLKAEITNDDAFEKDFDVSIKKEGDLFVIEKNAFPTVQFKLSKDNFHPICHTPFSSVPLQNKWIVYYKINNKIQNNLIVIDDFKGTKTVKFGLPAVAGKDEVKIHVVSNGYFGSDLVSSLNIKSY